jgi:peptidoglycan/xylan/chitin deacetylase (PgdA/CDA1 family)
MVLPVIGGLSGLYLLAWYIFCRLKLPQTGGRYLALHDVSDELDVTIARISPRQFTAILDFLAQTGMNCTSISSLSAPDDIALTFDDGWRSLYDRVLPVLTKYNFSATAFIIAGFVGQKSHWDYRKKQHLSWPEIMELKQAGIEIASHSVNHLDLRSLNDRRLEFEIAGSKKIIEDKLGQPVRYFSYPFGRFNTRVIEAVRNAGYQKAFALSYGRGDFAIPRQAVYVYDTPYSINRKLFLNSPLEKGKDYINNSLAGGTIWLRKLFPAGESRQPE